MKRQKIITSVIPSLLVEAKRREDTRTIRLCLAALRGNQLAIRVLTGLVP
jgi:hypothetical protein